MRTDRGFWWNLREHVRTVGEVYCSDIRQVPPGNGYTAVPRFVRWVALVVVGPLFGLEQWWFCVGVHERGWWPLPGHWFCLAHHAVARWVERRGVPMQWNPPDSGERGEIGFWSRSTGDHQRDPTRWFVYPSPGTTVVVMRAEVVR